MFYEEKCIDGLWRYRTSPEGAWQLLSMQTLAERLNAALADLQKVREDLQDSHTEMLKLHARLVPLEGASVAQQLMEATKPRPLYHPLDIDRPLESAYE